MFRTDIQALRGWAVCVVVFEHAKLGYFKSGFLGVDIFFVISGFLITGIVARSIAEGFMFGVQNVNNGSLNRVIGQMTPIELMNYSHVNSPSLSKLHWKTNKSDLAAKSVVG